ncbi:MAG: Multidrug resistance protein MdtA precursor [Pelotomaculum sp. PtaB.Bin104]|nr:MAG: Multidrug resistance protein MdtA precursor [Pelotomaculum sp. PtaB.Bin104]
MSVDPGRLYGNCKEWLGISTVRAAGLSSRLAPFRKQSREAVLMKKILLALLLIILPLFIGGCSKTEKSLVLKGEVETTIFSQHSEVSGKITSLPVELGQQVKAGDLIAEIDNSNELYAIEQLEAGLAKKQATLADLLAATDPEEIKQGQNNIALAENALASARLTYENDSKDFETTRTLYEAGALAKAAFDDAKYKLDLAQAAVFSAETQLDNAKQKLFLINKGADAGKIEFARADIAQTESQLRQAQDNLAKYKLYAVTSGTVISKNYLLGDLVAPGYNLVDIAAGTEKYLVAYLPEDSLSKVSYGQELVVRSGAQQYQGVVSFIDLQAQYTPKDMQTSANKNKNSIKIKVRLIGDNPLKPGEKVELLIN